MSKTEIKQNAQDRIMTGMRMEYSCFVEEVERASDDTVDVTTTTQTSSLQRMGGGIPECTLRDIDH